MFSGKAKSGVPLRQSIWICSYLLIFMLRRKGMPGTKITELWTKNIYNISPGENGREKRFLIWIVHICPEWIIGSDISNKKLKT
jgi:hypothetical protein